MTSPADAIRRAIEAHERALVELRQALATLEGEPAGHTLSVKQAAYLSGRSQRSTYRAAPELGVRVGGQWRIDPARLAKTMANFGERRQGHNAGAMVGSDHEIDNGNHDG